MMTGSGGSRGKVKTTHDSAIIAKKIVTHSKIDHSGEKFLKYIQYVSYLKRNSSRSLSPWKELRTYGALEAIMVAAKKIFEAWSVENSQREGNTEATSVSGTAKQICNVSLSVLSNAFAVDYSARSQGVRNGFIASVQQFIASLTQDSKSTFGNSEILGRAVKCTANLSNDPHCRESMLKSGVAISILRVLELANEAMTPNDLGEPLVDRKEHRKLLCDCVRAIRILTSDSKFMCKTNGVEHISRFGGLVTIISTLNWKADLSSDEDFVLDVIRAVTFLSLRIRSAPVTVIDKLTNSSAEVCKIQCLVKVLEHSEPDGKLYLPVIKCLMHLSANRDVSDCLGGLQIFNVILEKLKHSDETNYQDLIKLMIALTRNSSFNQSRLTTSPSIGSTLKILKSTVLQNFHEWLLAVYEKSYEVSLTKLIQCGLVDHLCDMLRQELEDCNYESLRRKISSLDDGNCSVHNQEACPFAPTYRCNSPSYQRIQEAMKATDEAYLIEYTQHATRGEDSLSPFSSPAHSWTSDESLPQYSEVSCSSLSEDEGFCRQGSALNGTESPKLQSRDFLSQDYCQEERTFVGDCEYEPPPLKKQKLDKDLSKADGSEKKTGREKSIEDVKISAKKIVGALNILHKCTYTKPFPEAILQIVPLLIGIILRGKVSMMSQGTDYQVAEQDDEYRDLSRRTFEVSYKILLKTCSTLQLFPEIIGSGIIPILHRLQEPVTDGLNTEGLQTVQTYCTNLIGATAGMTDQSAGWREGFMMRSLILNSSSETIDQLTLNIPLLYQQNTSILHKFETKAKSWTRILSMLANSDEASFYRFEDCALALISLCNGLGIKWTKVKSELPLLYPSSGGIGEFMTIACGESEASLPAENRVKLVLDDGTIFLVNKDILITTSPVFSAMFNGNFIESNEQRVHLPDSSKEAVMILLEQIFVLHCNSNFAGDNLQPGRLSECCSSYKHEISTMFELLALVDRFLLDDLHERVLNTMMTKYICPYSAPVIYTESVKLASLQKSSATTRVPGDLGRFILKYILTAESVRMSERCSAIRKIFASVDPEHIVSDLKTLVHEHNLYKINSLSFS